MESESVKKTVTAIVLAAGESKRMGRPKQLMPFGDVTMLEKVVATILQAGLNEVIVVLGHRAREIAPRLAGRPVVIVTNPDYWQGMSSSLRCGLGRASETVAAFMVVLGDQPLIGRDIVAKLLEEFARGGPGIVAPVYRGQRGHPVIFSSEYRLELLAVTGDAGARVVVEAHPEAVRYVEVDSPAVVTGIDTEADYRRYRP